MKILITGASAGIGEACALRLSKIATHLVLVARREERLQDLKSEILKINPQVTVEICVLDIQDGDFIQKVSEQKDVFKKIDILINNAGLARGSDPLHKGSVQDWEEMIDTNIKGLLYITRAVLPDMVERKQGHIVNLGSVAGRWVYPGGNVYNATKFAVRALSEGIRMDVSGTGIRVTNIEPGMVETEFSVVRLRDEDKAKKVYQGMKPLTAQDIAETIEWCCLRPSHVNIQELVIYPTAQASPFVISRT